VPHMLSVFFSSLISICFSISSSSQIDEAVGAGWLVSLSQDNKMVGEHKPYIWQWAEINLVKLEVVRSSSMYVLSTWPSPTPGFQLGSTQEGRD
jgi:hypothetical protein